MICRKCARIFDDSMSACPDCGAAAFGDEREISFMTEERRVNMPYAAQNTKADGGFTADEKASRKPIVITAACVNRKNFFDNESVPIETQSIDTADKNKSSDTGEENEKHLKQSTGDKSAVILIVALVMILSVMTVFLTAISVGSDIFRNDDEVGMTALSVFSDEETGKHGQ